MGVSRARSHWLNPQRLSLNIPGENRGRFRAELLPSSSWQLRWRQHCSSHAEYNPREEHPLKLLTWRLLDDWLPAWEQVAQLTLRDIDSWFTGWTSTSRDCSRARTLEPLVTGAEMESIQDNGVTFGVPSGGGKLEVLMELLRGFQVLRAITAPTPRVL